MSIEKQGGLAKSRITKKLTLVLERFIILVNSNTSITQLRAGIEK